MNEKSTQLAVIGGGPGGYPAAFLAADLGMQVTLIDPEPNPGGVCLYRGCIPTKTLLHVVRVIRETEEAGRMGLKFSKPEIDLETVRNWKETVVQKMTEGLGQLSELREIKRIRGRGRFLSSHMLEIDKTDNTKESLKFEHALIATGSRSASLPNIPFNASRILDSDSALELQNIPESLLVVGGGYIGLELGTIYSALGSRVTIVEMMDRLLPGADQDLVRVFSRNAKKTFESILLGTTVTDMKEQGQGIQIVLKNNREEIQKVSFEKVLITVGRLPNSENLGLNNTNVKINHKGFVQVNQFCHTDDPTIYAVGDVVGGPLLAHKATYEGKLAVQTIAGHGASAKSKIIPAVLFTDPEIAWCGLTEVEAQEKGRDFSVASFPWGASGRSATLGRNDGLTKLVVDPYTEKIVGVGIVGPGAGELIAEGVLAIEMGATVSDLSAAVHPHPTLSETLMEAAEMFHGRCTHFYRPLKKK
ncbi:dihydrolipoyl dehydrogenase [bacterium]|nr:dihydrolipoyl dehydrogenase [bacterium]